MDPELLIARLILGLALSALAFAGAGAYSLDGVLGLTSLSQPATTWITIAATVGLAFVNLRLRRPASASAPSHT